MITIIGNGESRKNIDISKINGMKVGCNAIYLYEKVDLICAMDKFWREKIIKECNIPLLSRRINNSFQTVLQIYDKSWYDTKCPYRGYCSGTTALDYICSKYKDDIYLIGFDFDYNGQYVNHIYKDSEMAISTLTKLSNTLEKKDNKIKDTVEDIIKGYERYFKDAKKILNKNNCKKEKNGFVSKVMANMGIDKEVKDDNSDSAISDMLIKGVSMGSIDLEKKIAKYKDKETDDKVLELANNFKDFQEDIIEKLKKYL